MQARDNLRAAAAAGSLTIILSASAIASPVGTGDGEARELSRNVTVSVDCFSVPEEIVITNDRAKPVVVKRIRTESPALRGRYSVSKRLEPGQSVTYRFGGDRSVRNRLGPEEALDDRSGRAHVEVLTSAGLAFADCGVRPSLADMGPTGSALFTGLGQQTGVGSVGAESSSPEQIDLFEGRTESWRWDTSDPRLSGDVSVVSNRLFVDILDDGAYPSYDLPPDRRLTVQSNAYEVANEQGRWRGHSNAVVLSKDVEAIVLTGVGAYDGLTAYVSVDYTAHIDFVLLEGAIIEGAVAAPAPPDQVSASSLEAATASRPGRRALEEDLLFRPGIGPCDRWRDPEDEFLRAGALAAIKCDYSLTAARGADLKLYAFPSRAEMDDAWVGHVTSSDGLGEVDRACKKGTTGHTGWTNGRIACAAEDGAFRIIWTDDRIDLMGSIEGPARFGQRLYGLWRFDGRSAGDRPRVDRKSSRE